MNLLVELQENMGVNEFYKWIMISKIFSIVFSYINFFLFINLFNVKTTNKRKWLLILLDSSIRFLGMLLIPAPYYRAINILITILLFKFGFQQNIEKCILGEVINSITIICVELIFSKLFCNIFRDVGTYVNGMYDYRYKFCLMFSISLFRLIICYIIKKKNLKINLNIYLNKRYKASIIIVSIIGSMIIFFNVVEMTMYISDFPYSIFVLDIVSLIIYFYISMKDIIKIIKLEEQDTKIHNLESYNKTLTIMYDSIRGFRHDFFNFVQALDGYVKINDIDGIRKMSKSILEDCMNVNNMGILDPNIINNPAVYSIITNKYYMAQKENIKMNIEVMINLKEINIPSYDFCRILSILLDNAIEAAKECDEKIINISFEKDIKVNRKLIIIENTYKKIDIDIEKIFEKGYSTKKTDNDKHGLGLWTVRNILRKSNSLNLFTTKGKLFCQQLEIYE